MKPESQQVFELYVQSFSLLGSGVQSILPRGPTSRTSLCWPALRVDLFFHPIQQPVLIHDPALPLIVPTFVKAVLFDDISHVQMNQRRGRVLRVEREESSMEGFACARCAYIQLNPWAMDFAYL